LHEIICIKKVEMKKVTGISLIFILITCVFFGSISCGGKAGDTVTQAEYDAVKAQLSAAEAKVAELKAAAGVTVSVPQDPALKDEIASLKAKITELGNTITELNKQNNSLTQEKASSETRYAALLTKYQDLEKKLAAATTPQTITEELVENEILRLLGQERVKAGLPEFVLGPQLRNQAKTNSRAMAAAGKVVTNPDYLYQEVFWAAYYTSVDAIARAALATWKLNQYAFEHGTLLPGNKYGAVGAYESGGIIFITYLAAFYP
jgi:uncharacterized protein YkwD